jgi:hypothetical protein
MTRFKKAGVINGKPHLAGGLVSGKCLVPDSDPVSARQDVVHAFPVNGRERANCLAGEDNSTLVFLGSFKKAKTRLEYTGPFTC